MGPLHEPPKTNLPGLVFSLPTLRPESHGCDISFQEEINIPISK